MQLKDLFTTYWSQITLLLFTFGYLIKYTLDLVFKKREINFSIIQNRRLDAINNFFTKYVKVESMWLGLSIYPILREDIKATEIDNIIFRAIDDFKSSVFETKLYLYKNEQNNFELLYDNMMLINKKLYSLYLDSTFSGEKLQKVSDKVYEFTSYRDEILRKNLIVINEIGIVVRKSYS